MDTDTVSLPGWGGHLDTDAVSLPGWSLMGRYAPDYSLPVDRDGLATYRPEPDTLWFFFEGERVLLAESRRGEAEAHASPTPLISVEGMRLFAIGTKAVPCGGTPGDWVAGVQSVHLLGTFAGHACCAVRVMAEPAPREPDVLSGPDGANLLMGRVNGRDGGTCREDLQWFGLRDVLPDLDEDAGFLAGRALQILNWERNNRFCGRCGERMEPRTDERSMRCPACGFLQYPRLSPAVIVAVTRGDSLLLAHNKRFPSGRYSLLAGFVEPGETFEDCVAREISEEVGIHVKNIRYLSSQPWPFPDSLMVGFSAEWESGELHPDGMEIGEADWFRAEGMPDYPGPHTIAGKIIRMWLRALIP